MSRIKGITIEIDGSTKGLDKALQGVNKQSRDLQSELRQVERLLKFNPGNVELITQKQKLLSDQVEATSNKLKQLKDAESQVQAQFERGDIKEEQYRAFQREIVETESKLKHYSTQLKNVEKDLNKLGQSMQNAGKGMKEFGNKATSAGKSMTAKVTTPLLGVGVVAAKIGSDFEASMSKVAAVSGATGSELEDLTKKAREIGAETQFSASEAADALNYMGLAGWSTQEMLEGIDGVMSLAAASGEDLGLVSDIVTDGLSAFGLTAQDSARFADVLASASANANTDVAQLGKAFEYVGPVAGALGFSIEDVSKAIGLMSNAGIKGEKAGTALRSMMTNLAKPTAQMEVAMSDLGLSLTDSEGQMKSFDQIMVELRTSFSDLTEAEQASAAATIFGKEAMSGALAVINASESDYNNLSDAVNNSAGSAEEMAKVINDNLQGRLKEMKSALEEAAISIYDNLQPALESVIAFIKRLADWFNNLSPAIQNTIVVLAGIMAAIGPLLVVIGVFASSLGSIITVAGKLIPILGSVGKIFTVFRTAIMALSGPIGIAIAAITALVAVGIYVYKNWDDVKEKLSKIWETIANVATDVWNGISNFFKQWGSTILAIVTGPIGIMAKIIYDNWDKISSFLTNVANKIKDTLSQKFNQMRDVIQNVMNNVENTIVNIWNNAESFLRGINLFEIGKNIIDGLIKGIVGKARDLWDAVTNIGKSIKKVFTGEMDIHSPSRVFEEYGENIGDGLADGINGSIAKATEASKKLSEAVKKSFESAMGWVDDQKYFEKISTDEELEILNSLYGKYKNHAEQRKKLDREIFRVKKELEKEGFEHSKSWIDERKYYNELSLEEELKAWERMQERYKKGSDNRKEIDREIYRVKKELEKKGFEHSKDWIDERKYYNELSLEEELKAWMRVQSRYNEGSEERKEIDREVYRVQKELNEKRKKDLEEVEESYKEVGKVIGDLSELEKKYYSDITEARSEYEKKVKETRRNLQKDMVNARQDYLSNVSRINKELIENERKLTDDYNKELNSRVDSLVNFTGIFDEVSKSDVSGEQLLQNLKGQVDAFEDWQENMNELSSKGINETLLEQLRDMGPKAGSEIAALNRLSESQLKEYVKLWEEKQKLAKNEAVGQLSKQRAEMNSKLQQIRQDAQDQLQQQSIELEKNLQSMRAKANSELEKYKIEWKKKNEEIRKNAEEQIKVINDSYNELTNSSTQYGIDMIDNFIEGATSQFGRLRSTMEKMTQMVDDYMPHSPAKVGPLKKLGEWGPGLVKSFADGINNTMPRLRSAIDNMTKISNIASNSPNLGVTSTENNYGGNVININMSPGTPRDTVDEVVRELHKRGIKF